MNDSTTRSGSPRKRVRLKAEDRRAEILGAAQELFGERGYWGTSLQEVAERCGFTVTGVLYHFGSKEGVLRALLDSLDSSYVEELGRYGRGEDGADGKAPGYRLGDVVPGANLGSICRVLVHLSEADPKRTRLYSRLENESTEAGHPAHDFFLRREQRLLDAYEVNVPSTEADPQAVARMVMALISGLRVQWLREPESMDLLATWDRLAAGIPVLRPRGSGAGGGADDGAGTDGAEAPTAGGGEVPGTGTGTAAD